MQARIICDFELEGQRFTPEQTVIDAPAETIAALVAAGNADDHPAAVSYALDQGAEIIAIGPRVDAEKPAKTTRRKKD